MQKITILVLFLTCGCIKSDNLFITKTTYSSLSNWHNDNHAAALENFIRSCKKLKINQWQQFAIKNGIEPVSLTSSMQHQCRKAVKSKSNPKQFFQNNFVPYKITSNNNDKGLFTGYCEFGLKGSKIKTNRYVYPIYKMPDNAKNINQYYSRKQINAGILTGRKLEIAYVKDPVRLFFLHIQGSGIIYLDNGKHLRVTYAGQNKQQYLSISRYLRFVEKVPREELNAQSIIKWLRYYDFKANNIMEMNKSYVFFRVNNNSSPIGAQSVPLTSERSLAIDKKYLPLGALMWLDTKYPDNTPFNKLMLAQDTGGAIKGAIRGDIYFGTGIKAEMLASNMANQGRYYILLPKSITLIPTKE